MFLEFFHPFLLAVGVAIPHEQGMKSGCYKKTIPAQLTTYSDLCKPGTPWIAQKWSNMWPLATASQAFVSLLQ